MKLLLSLGSDARFAESSSNLILIRKSGHRKCLIISRPGSNPATVAGFFTALHKTLIAMQI
jgi:hypothetical protein